jgi:hypothetical protein
MMRPVDIPTAALAVDVRTTVIRVWIRRGHLALHDGMLDLAEVWACERERRRTEQRCRMVDSVLTSTVTLRAVGRSAP